MSLVPAFELGVECLDFHILLFAVCSMAHNRLLGVHGLAACAFSGYNANNQRRLPERFYLWLSFC